MFPSKVSVEWAKIDIVLCNCMLYSDWLGSQAANGHRLVEEAAMGGNLSGVCPVWTWQGRETVACQQEIMLRLASI